MCGFADHSHNNAPCPKCTVTQENLFTDEALRNDEHNDFFEQHGARWTELARLPYFDLVRHTIIDPMHNLLLGIVKTQWYSQWILTPALRASTQTRARELDIMHKFLSTFESPLWAGKLPLRVGEPAGGSLTADEYKFAATTAWPIIVPVIWDSFIEEAENDLETSLRSYSKRQDQYLKEYKTWKEQQEAPSGSSRKGKATKGKGKEQQQPKPPKQPKVRMQHEEPVNFLRLSTALKIFCGSSLYGAEAMKPNFHWAVHLRQQILDYGPVYNFWAFLSERLNKVLKSSNSNNWTGGQVEISMMREFARGAQIDSLVNTFTSFYAQ
ncbi:hypothetical protein BDN67DRAFT_996960 [Paxillus ammoniavirescens]|nr:hypothetical protein BDN67DRAFT_996960 [Paxillus ammoniavirescens]